jgi:very-short-patch-repair endonuclease
MEIDREITAYINVHPIYRNFIENLPYNIKLKARSRALRKAGVLSEVIFWLQVHKGIFWKIDFDRQRIIGNYIVDFYVKTLGLVIEIDGSSHDNKEEYDQKREDYLVSLGLRVYRISDLRIKHDLNNVMLELESYIVLEFGNKSTNI